MSYEIKATNYDEFGTVKDDYPDCEWIVIKFNAVKRGPKKPMSFKVIVGAFPYTVEDDVRIYSDRPVKKAELLNISNLMTEYPDLYVTVGTAIYTHGVVNDGYFKDAPMA